MSARRARAQRRPGSEGCEEMSDNKAAGCAGVDGCPPWCHEHHHGTTSADDQHQGVLESLPVVERVLRTHEGSEVTPTRVATTLDVVRHCGTDDVTEWVFVGDDEHQFDLSLASARSLVAALERAISA